MNKLRNLLTTNFFPLSLIILGLIIRLAMINMPNSWLLTNILSDDAFYYFKLAQNMAAGLGSTFDGWQETNGYHPLWLWLIVPIFKNSQSIWQPIQITLILSAIINALTNLGLLAIISKYTKNIWIKVLGIFVFVFNPFNIYESINGLETGLALLFLVLFILVAINLKNKKSFWLFILWGIIGAAMMLARLDNVFYYIAGLAWIFFTQDKKWQKVFVVGLTSTVLVLPWLIWSKLKFGTILTSSGSASTIVNHHLIVQDHGPGLAQQIKAVFYSSYYGLQMAITQTGAPELFLIVFGLALAWLVGHKTLSKKGYKKYSVEVYLFLGFILLFLLNASLRWTYRTWYFISINIYLVLAIVWYLQKIRHWWPAKAKFYILFGILLASSFYISWSRHLVNRDARQIQMQQISIWANNNLPADTKIGVFNAGIQGYFSNNKVVNLDGLVNFPGYRALAEYRLWDYAQEEGIEYLIDFDVYLDYRYNAFFGIDDLKSRLELIEHDLLEAQGPKDIKVYKIKK
ncbi:MAG: hypothetical protein HOE19_00210 [Candidatus Komeilibacteria bacterium]|jgi:hypothetical protein|nr:hypothetical protein [Candidatus Komeilibacteria bacterium]MBT4448031.1 hypothetical protein [Candidatus Komeilibacteria bacterium]